MKTRGDGIVFHIRQIRDFWNRVWAQNPCGNLNVFHLSFLFFNARGVLEFGALAGWSLAGPWALQVRSIMHHGLELAGETTVQAACGGLKEVMSDLLLLLH